MLSPTEEVRAAVADRLAVEFGDAELGADVADQLDLRAIQVLVDQPALIDGDFLSFTPRVEPDPELLIVYAFGNRFDDDGALRAGPVNVELARRADAWARAAGLQVFDQWEVADEMQSGAVRIGAIELDDGSIEYLSTAGVAEQVRNATDVDRVAVLRRRRHLGPLPHLNTWEGSGPPK